MAIKGKAAKSATGASMSKYDVEVEARLQALEKQAHPTPTGATQKKVDDRLKALESKVGEINNIEGMINDLVSQVSELQGQVSNLNWDESQESGSNVAATLDNLIHFLKVQLPKQFKFYND